MKRAALAILIVFAPGLAHAQHTQEQVRDAVKAAGGAEAFLEIIVSESSTMLPTMTNRNVEMRSVSSNGLKMMYLARLVNVDIKEAQDLESLKAANVNYLACRSPILGTLIDEYGVEVIYVTVAKGTEYLFQYNLNKKSCKGK